MVLAELLEQRRLAVTVHVEVQPPFSFRRPYHPLPLALPVSQHPPGGERQKNDGRNQDGNPVLQCIGNSNHLFSVPSNIAGPGSCQFLFCLMKIPVLLLLAWTAQQSEAREVFREKRDVVD